MKITTKINLLTTIWMVCILIIINIVVYFLFMTMTINMEKNMLYKNSDEIITSIQTMPTSNIEEKLKNFLTYNSFIRVLSSNNDIVYEASNDSNLSTKINKSYTRIKSGKTRVIAGKKGEEQILITHVPFKIDKSPYSLEMAVRLQGLEMRKEILRVILIVGTILASFLSLFGGRWFANIIMRPISNIINTMSEIEDSGVIKKINIHNDSKDELQTMIITFNKMMDRLKKNIEKQNQFVSDASHELKTPLTVIKTYVGILRRRGFENKTIAKEAIQAIDSETNRIQKIIETLLDLATLENQTTLNISTVDLPILLQELLNQMKPVYKRQIDLDIKDYDMRIQADELMIKQLIIILLDNAIKYSNDKIECILEKVDINICISIKDYGIGIPENELQNIFERFYRVDKARSRETGGTGLGLNIAKNIIKLHKGNLNITSTEGVGTNVQVIIPSNNPTTK